MILLIFGVANAKAPQSDLEKTQERLVNCSYTLMKGPQVWPDKEETPGLRYIFTPDKTGFWVHSKERSRHIDVEKKPAYLSITFPGTGLAYIKVASDDGGDFVEVRDRPDQQSYVNKVFDIKEGLLSTDMQMTLTNQLQAIVPQRMGATYDKWTRSLEPPNKSGKLSKEIEATLRAEISACDKIDEVRGLMDEAKKLVIKACRFNNADDRGSCGPEVGSPGPSTAGPRKRLE